MEGWCEEFPGLELAPSALGYEIQIPPAIRSGHEAHFAMVLERFLDYLDAGRWPDALTAGIRTRYELLARAHELAVSKT